MPEGPEIWILAKVCELQCFGKHLFTQNNEDWSFGLTGTVYYNTIQNTLHKVNTGFLPGSIKPFDKATFTGVDWMSGTKEQIEHIIFTIWKSSRKKMAALLLDQTQIAGIGVAWGSEICAKAGLNPAEKACNQNLSLLPNVLCELQTQIKHLYTTYANSCDKTEFINLWFKSLYSVRQMTVYKNKQCTEVVIGGRTWWINSYSLS